MLPSNHSYTLAELTKNLDVKINGDAQHAISGVATIQQAESHQITFLVNPLYRKHLLTTSAGAVILTKDDAANSPVNTIICQDPYYIYTQIAAYFAEKNSFTPGIHPNVIQGKDCMIAANATIGANCILGNHVKIDEGVVIGPGCIIEDNVTIGAGTKIDARVTLHYRVQIGQRVHLSSGVVIGSDGFGIAKHGGVWHKVPQLGTVRIEDDVDIGANTTIDRGAIEDTVIGRGAKLDNQIQIGHNVHIGEYTAIAGCVGIAGSATIGSHCLIGGGAGIAGHITIADNVMITGMTAVTKSIKIPGVYSSGVGGVVSNAEWRKNSARLRRLDSLVQRIKALENVLTENK